ncbi:MAG TPA: SDR family oxidoreductase [Phycisphaerae bacterium]|nr:SDR family oxidoreductase [Phycisphaerae bacterium]
MKSIRGKKALVTGAASGIGREIALALAGQGAELFLLDIDEEGLSRVAASAEALGVSSRVRRCDLADGTQISAAVRAVLDCWGRVDILVNNAGVAYYGPTDRMTPELWQWLLGVNLLAPIQWIRELLPTFLAQGEAHVLNVSSVGGLVAQTRMAAYHASKFALVGLTESLRAEYNHRGIGFTCLCPGLADTNIFRNTVSGRRGKPVKVPPRWLLVSPRRVARKAVAGIRRNRGLVLVSPMAHVLWGLKRLSPWLMDFINRFRRSKRKPFPSDSQPHQKG